MKFNNEELNLENIKKTINVKIMDKYKCIAHLHLPDATTIIILSSKH